MVSRDTYPGGEDEEEFQEAQDDLTELHRLVELDMLGKVLDTYEGRRIIGNIIGSADIYEEQEPVSYDLAISQRQIGRREVALSLFKDTLTIRPNVFNLMREEAEEFLKKYSAGNLDQLMDKKD